MTQSIDFLLGEIISKPINTMQNSDIQYAVYGVISAEEYISKIDKKFEQEKKILGRTVKNLLLEKGAVSNKNIIISLIKQLELCKELKKIELLRSCLEIIVGITADDIF